VESTDFFEEVAGCLVSATVEESIWCPSLGDVLNVRGGPKVVWGMETPPTCFLEPVRTEGEFLIFLCMIYILVLYNLEL
jgi:hypothetical protein